MYAAEVHATVNGLANSMQLAAKLRSPIHYGSPIISNSTLSFAYLVKGPSSLSVQATLDQGGDAIRLWSTERQPQEQDTRWENAQVFVPETESFSVSLIKD